MNGVCPRCGQALAAMRRFCPRCRAQLEQRGLRAGERFPVGAVVLVGLLLVAGAFFVAATLAEQRPVTGKALPPLLPPDSEVLGDSSASFDIERPGDRPAGGNDFELLADHYSVELPYTPYPIAARSPVAVDGEYANVPPLITPVGASEPPEGPVVPPVEDVDPLLPPPAVTATVASRDADGSSEKDDDDDPACGGGNILDADADVDLTDFDRGSDAYTVLLRSPGAKDEAVDTAELAARNRLDSGVLEVRGIPELDGADGDWVAFAGQFDDEDDARKLAKRCDGDLNLDLKESVLFVPSFGGDDEKGDDGGSGPDDDVQVDGKNEDPADEED